MIGICEKCECEATLEWYDEPCTSAALCSDCLELEDEECCEDSLSDVEADAMTLASAGLGTDEDYGYYGDGEDF